VPVISTVNESRKSLNNTFDDEDLNSSMISYNSGWALKQGLQIDDAFETSIMQEMQQRELKIKELQSDKQKLKALLRKAREVIESTNQNYKGACE
jgi:hypothetical protein